MLVQSRQASSNIFWQKRKLNISKKDSIMYFSTITTVVTQEMYFMLNV